MNEGSGAMLQTRPRARDRQVRRAGRQAAVAAWLLGATLSLGGIQAANIPVPNSSFESPFTAFADPRIDGWQETPKPDWYDESGGYLWDQLTGVYLNLPPEDPETIVNCDGSQAVWIFAVPQAGFFQDYMSIDWSATTPSHAFDARFEVGKGYQLTVGVLGGGGNMQTGVSLLVGLYYRNASGDRVSVAATNIVYVPPAVPGAKQFTDVAVHVPTVQATDACAGQHIGIQLVSTVDPALAGGFWDLDHVRLKSTVPTVLLRPSFAEGQFGFALESEPGLTFEILAAADPGLPWSDWTSVGTVTNTAGSVRFQDEAAPTERRFYRARQVE